VKEIAAEIARLDAANPDDIAVRITEITDALPNP